MSNFYQSPNNSQPFGPTPQPPQQPVIMVATNRNRVLAIIMVVLLVLLVAILGVIAWVYFNGTYQGHTPVLLKNQGEIETTTPANDAAPVVPQAAPAAPVTVTVPAPAGNGGASNNSNSGNSGYESLTTLSTRCSSYAYAGTNGSDFVSVCNDGGGYTYKAYVNGGYLERPASGGSGQFVVDASPHTITVSGANVFVQDSNGDTVLTVPMTNWRS